MLLTARTPVQQWRYRAPHDGAREQERKGEGKKKQQTEKEERIRV